MPRKIKVRLNADLTKYISGLVPGVEGYTIGQYRMWSCNDDNFIGVHFPGITKIDVLWKALDIIDYEYLKEVQERNIERREELKSATNVVLAVGPRGGFKYLTFSYNQKDGVPVHMSVGFKNQAERFLKIFEEQGIPVDKRTI